VRLGPTVTPDEADITEGIARVRSLYAGVCGYDRRQQIA
jgi:hypothetical protein